MARPSKTNQRETRREILDAALELFAQQGFHGTGMREIARTVGINEASLYHYFPSKEQLLDAVLFEPDDAGRPALAPAFPTGFDGHTLAALHDWLVQVLLGILDQFADPKEAQRFRIFLSDGLRLAAAGKVNYLERIVAVQLPILLTLQRLQDQGMLRPTEPFLLMMSLIGPLMMWRHMLVLGPELPPIQDRQGFVRHHVGQLLRGAAVDPSQLSAEQE
jgi:AcrR family transcriptional regulator